MSQNVVVDCMLHEGDSVVFRARTGEGNAARFVASDSIVCRTPGAERNVGARRYMA